MTAEEDRDLAKGKATDHRRVESAAGLRVDAAGVLSRSWIPDGFDFGSGITGAGAGSIADLVPDDVAQVLVEAIRRVLDDGAPSRVEYASGGEPAGQDGRYYQATIFKIADRDALVVLEDTTSRKQAEEALIRSRDQFRNLAGHVELVREEERKRIAREVHDVLGQALTALRIDVASIRNSIGDNEEEVRDRINLVNDSITTIIHTVRRIASDLRPGVLDDLGIVAALEWQTEEFSGRTGITSTFRSEFDHIDLDSDKSTALFRITQESLTNVLRHAEASAVHVSLKRRDGSLVLSIKDNGRGIRDAEINDHKSLGLVGIQERVSPWGGHAEFRGVSGEGTSVTVSLPLDV